MIIIDQEYDSWGDLCSITVNDDGAIYVFENPIRID